MYAALRAVRRPVAHQRQIVGRGRAYLGDAGVGALVDARNAALLVHPDSRRDVDEVIKLRDEVSRIDERCVGRLRGSVPLACSRHSASVLGDRNDLEVRVLQLFVDGLPPGQVIAAPSPGGPGDDQDLLPLEVGQPHQLAFPIGEREIGRHRRLKEALRVTGMLPKLQTRYS